MRHLTIGTVKEKKEIFRIRIIGIPSPEEDLRGPLAHFFLEAVVIGGTDLKLNPEFFKLPLVPLLIGARPLRGILIIKKEH